MPADDLVVSRSVRIPRHELDVSFSASGGPGGQHANRSNTRVELRFDIAASSAFGPVQRQRLIARYGPELRIVADGERSQLRNRLDAERRLVERLNDGLRVARSRRPTKPSASARARRVEAKVHRGQIKRARRRPSLEE